MKRIVLSLLLLITCLVTQAQIKFEKGYFINNQGTRTECFIKNEDWRSNPVRFEYRITEDSKTEYGSIKLISEFSVLNVFKYIRKNVDIDKSSTLLQELSLKRHPQFENEELYLSVLVSGTANLYKYAENGVSKYFFSKSTEDINQLVYKEYFDKFQINVLVNDMYKQQLFNEVNCNATPIQKIIPIKYHEKDLVKYFTNYNMCSGDKTVEIQKVKRDWFNLRVKSGVSFSELNVDHRYERDVDFEKKTMFRIGVETEFVLPFKKNKWSVFFEPTYQRYNTKALVNNGATIEEYAFVDYKFVEFPVGLRHRFFIGEKSNIFVNAGYVIIVSLNSEIDYESTLVHYDGDIEIASENNMFVGIGVELFDKFGIEYRFYGERDLTQKHSNYISNYKSSSVIVSYKLF